MRNIAILLILTVFASGCAQGKSIGLVNELAKNSQIDGVAKPEPCTRYEIIWGNVIWGIILSETIVAPIYFFGFSVLDPVGQLTLPNCQVTL